MPVSGLKKHPETTTHTHTRQTANLQQVGDATVGLSAGGPSQGEGLPCCAAWAGLALQGRHRGCRLSLLHTDPNWELTASSVETLSLKSLEHMLR